MRDPRWICGALLMASVLAGEACRRREKTSEATAAVAEGVPACVETNARPEIAARCMACLKNAPNDSREGCCDVKDPLGRQLCDKVAACMRAGGPPVGACNVGGDTTTCYCGTHVVNCWDPGVPNGPCLALIAAAAGRNIETLKTDSPNEDQILKRYGDIKYVLGRASNIASIAGAFCAAECEIVKN